MNFRRVGGQTEKWMAHLANIVKTLRSRKRKVKDNPLDYIIYGLFEKLTR